jgi:ABC-2 type transport system ATP-binding protein
MRRRLDLALALIHHPRIVYLDEPTTGLDPAARRAVWAEIESLRARGVTVLLTTQYLDEADRLCDRVAIIDRGSIAAEGTPADLKRSLGGDVIEIEMSAPEAAVTAAAVLGDGASVHGRSVRLPAHDGRSRIPSVVVGLQQRGLELASLALVEPTLDDVFLELTGRRPGTSTNGGSAAPEASR